MLRAHLSGEMAPPLEAVAGSAWTGRASRRPRFPRRFPHQLSGGQQQRVCIAVALVCEPPVVVLDEPTTGLDVVTQARILAELRRLRASHGIAMVYVTHDLAVVAAFADRLAVMYAGRVVEHGPTAVVLRRPRHPYTRGLLASIPDHVARAARADAGRRGRRRRAPARLRVRAALPAAHRALLTRGCPRSRTVQLGRSLAVRCFRLARTDAAGATASRAERRASAGQRRSWRSSGLRAEHRGATRRP